MAANNPWIRGFDNLGAALFGDPNAAGQLAYNRARTRLTEQQIADAVNASRARSDLGDLFASLPGLREQERMPVQDPGIGGTGRAMVAQQTQDVRDNATRRLAAVPERAASIGSQFVASPSDLADLFLFMTANDGRGDDATIRALAGTGKTIGVNDAVSLGGQDNVRADNAANALREAIAVQELKNRGAMDRHLVPGGSDTPSLGDFGDTEKIDEEINAVLGIQFDEAGNPVEGVENLDSGVRGRLRSRAIEIFRDRQSEAFNNPTRAVELAVDELIKIVDTPAVNGWDLGTGLNDTPATRSFEPLRFTPDQVRPFTSVTPEEGASLRPFEPGEFVDNLDGTRSTERSLTVPLPNGQWMNIPSLWMSANGPVDFGRNEDAAARMALAYEQRTGQQFPRYGSVEEGVAASQARSAGGGVFQGGAASAVSDVSAPRPGGGGGSGQQLQEGDTIVQGGNIFKVINGQPVYQGPAQ